MVLKYNSLSELSQGSPAGLPFLTKVGHQPRPPGSFKFFLMKNEEYGKII